MSVQEVWGEGPSAGGQGIPLTLVPHQGVPGGLAGDLVGEPVSVEPPTALFTHPRDPRLP